MDIRGGYRFSSLVKQNKKAKICAVICFAGKKKLLFHIYTVIVKKFFRKRFRLYYSHSRIHMYKKVSACTSTQVYISVKCACNSTQVCIRACVCAFEPACVYVRPRVREHTHSTARNITDGRTDGRTDG